MSYLSDHEVAGFREAGDDPQPSHGKAIYAYEPVRPDELALTPGDFVTVLKRGADGWSRGVIEGSLGSGLLVGFFPTTYVQFEGEAAQAQQAPAPAAAPAAVLYQVKMLYAYTDPESGNSCQAGDVLDVISDSNAPDWNYIRSGAAEYYVPKNYCETIVVTPAAHTVPKHTRPAHQPIKPAELPVFNQTQAPSPQPEAKPETHAKPTVTRSKPHPAAGGGTPLSQRPGPKPPPTPQGQKPPLARSSIIQDGAVDPVKLEGLRVQLEEMQQQVAAQQAENDAAEAELQSLQGQVEATQQEIASLKSEQSSSGNSQQAQRDLDTAKAHLQAIRSACAAVEDIIMRHAAS